MSALSNIVKLLFSAFVVLIAVVGHYIWSRHWKNADIGPQMWDQDANFTVLEVPMTRYKSGSLSSILKEWRHEFHVYRLEEGEKFKLDMVDTFGTSKVRAKSLLKECKWESSICSPCFDWEKKVTEIPTTQIFSEPGWYASFAKIDNSIVGKLWTMLGFPFKVEDTVIEHAFISNLRAPMVTAQMHANPLTSSMGVQFVGEKTWIFVPPKHFLAEDGFDAVPASVVLLPRRAPVKPFEIYLYRSKPGDVLFFPESWAHIVWTHEGPGFLLNYRRITLGNFLRQPFTWFTAAFNMIFFGKVYHDPNIKSGAGTIQDSAVPEKELNIDAYKAIDEVCIKGGGISKFDKQMLAFLHKFVGRK